MNVIFQPAGQGFFLIPFMTPFLKRITFQNTWRTRLGTNPARLTLATSRDKLGKNQTVQRSKERGSEPFSVWGRAAHHS